MVDLDQQQEQQHHQQQHHQRQQQHQEHHNNHNPQSYQSLGDVVTTTTNSADNNCRQPGFQYRVGYWWSEKKSQKLNATELAALFAERQCQLIKIDLDRPIEEQGPFSLIVHKISDILVKADQGDATAKKTISAFESYVRKHLQTVILDPLDNNRALLDRYKQYRLIEQSGLAKEGVVFTPPFVHLTSTNIDVNRGRIRRSKITFPLVCKPILAQGSTGAHQMCIIFNEAGLKDVKPPCVAQSFVNHNAKLFKLFVIKDKYYIMERPSLKNFQAGDQETVFFYSHDISKPNSSSSLTELDEQDKLKLQDLMEKMRLMNTEKISGKDDDDYDYDFDDNDNDVDKGNTDDVMPTNGETSQTITLSTTNTTAVSPHTESSSSSSSKLCGSSCGSHHNNNYINSNNMQQGNNNQEHDSNNRMANITHYSPLMPSKQRLTKIVKIFSEKLGLTFYGIDIIIENGTSRYAIIDMNTFPGYDGVENFLTIFRDVVCDAVPKDINHQNQMLQMKINRRKPTEIDSGIEST